MVLLRFLLPDLGRRLAPLPARRRRRRGADVRPAGGQHRPHAVRAGRQTGVDKLLNAWGQNVVLACACAVVAVRVWTGGAPGSQAAAGRRWCCGRSATCGGGSSSTTWSTPPFPSPADAGWLAFYPCAYLCIGLRLRASARDLPRSAWLDGLVGILSVGAIGVTLVVAPVLAERGGEPGGRADQRRLPARGPAAARPHGRGARPARTARRTRLGAAGGRLRALRLRQLALPRAPRRRHVHGRHGARLAVGRRAGDHGARELAAAREAGQGRSRPPGRAGAAAALRRRGARRCSSTPASSTSRRSRSRSRGRPCSPRWPAPRSPSARSAASTRRAARRRRTSSPGCPTAASSAASCARIWPARANTTSRSRC